MKNHHFVCCVPAGLWTCWFALWFPNLLAAGWRIWLDSRAAAKAPQTRQKKYSDHFVRHVFAVFHLFETGSPVQKVAL